MSDKEKPTDTPEHSADTPAFETTSAETPNLEVAPVAENLIPESAEETITPSPAEPAPVAVEPEVSDPLPVESEASAPAGNNSSAGYTAPPPPPHAPQVAQPALVQTPKEKKPRTLETAFAFLFFLGLFGGHKFYMGQKILGPVYLLAGLAFVVILDFPFIGSLLSTFFLVALLLNLYADIRTIREQLERSERGEEFTFDDQMEFFKKAFQS